MLDKCNSMRQAVVPQVKRFFALTTTAFALILLAGCTAADTDPGRQLRADYPNLAVTRLGDFEFRYQYAQDTAILRSLSVLRESGLDKAAIKEVAIQSDRGAGLAASRFSQQAPNSYSLWYIVKGCPQNVFFRAGVTGHLIEMIDPAGCTGGDS